MNRRTLTAAALCLAAATLHQAQDLPDLATVRQQAEQGDPEAQHRLARTYYRNATRYDVPADYPQAAHWFRKAAEQGHPRAQFRLALLYYDGRGGLPRDHRQTYKWTHVAALRGDIEAQRMMGHFYHHPDGYAGPEGDPVPQDLPAAWAWYHIAREDELSRKVAARLMPAELAAARSHAAKLRYTIAAVRAGQAGRPYHPNLTP